MDEKSLYIVFQWNPQTQSYSSNLYNGSRSKKPAFRRLSITEVNDLHKTVVAGIGKMLFKCLHVTNAKNVPQHVRDVHEDVAMFSHAKGGVTND